MGLTKIYQDAPPAGKILMLAVGAFAGYKGYKYAQKFINPTGTDKADKEEKKSNEDFINKNKSELDKLEKNWKKLTYSPASYVAWANTLYKAMDGVGTDTSKINNVFSYMKNDTDVRKLIDAFGVRNRKTNNPFSSAAEALALPAWITEELATYEVDNLNKILYQRNIAFRF